MVPARSRSFSSSGAQMSSESTVGGVGAALVKGAPPPSMTSQRRWSRRWGAARPSSPAPMRGTPSAWATATFILRQRNIFWSTQSASSRAVSAWSAGAAAPSQSTLHLSPPRLACSGAETTSRPPRRCPLRRPPPARRRRPRRASPSPSSPLRTGPGSAQRWPASGRGACRGGRAKGPPLAQRISWSASRSTRPPASAPTSPSPPLPC
mmetsp:Transcript_4381/g.11320  ORF Transcript_4381/g.11320 Transcript_4381/m.11320 type:complete len:208 (+) Transcript_4381:623-1246(+)